MQMMIHESFCSSNNHNTNMVIIKHRPTVFTLLGHYQQNMYSL
ncbi:hypothetical protein OIU84_007332, partial [Salix udensis]